MEIIRGKIPGAQKIVVYGPEGIGKSTFASKFPNPIFIDTEGSTRHMDVARLKKPSSYPLLCEEVKYIINNPDICRTLVIDTMDWAEQLCISDLCSRYNKKGIEDFGYGNGYVYAKEEIGRFLNLLDEVIERQINVVLTAHAQIRKFEQPDELGAYDRYELKLGKKTSSQTSPLIKEWADTILFANYKTLSIATDDNGKKFKAHGGTRVMYTAHHPCWDAKNRWGLKEEVPFDYNEIARFIPGGAEKVRETERTIQEETIVSDKQEKPKENNQVINEGIPKALKDLMDENFVTEDEIRLAVFTKGYYPLDMPIEKYPSEFISGVLIGAWPQVFKTILAGREDEDTPF